MPARRRTWGGRPGAWRTEALARGAGASHAWLVMVTPRRTPRHRDTITTAWPRSLLGGGVLGRILGSPGHQRGELDPRPAAAGLAPGPTESPPLTSAPKSRLG